MSSLSKEYPFLDEYFAKSVDAKKLAHCILFWGNDVDAQYQFALEIARKLNCKSGGNEDCNCLNCDWIRQNNHPAVLTYSKKDNKSTDDDSPNVISIMQAREIKQNLMITSDYHRVLIFCDKDEDGNVCGLNETNFSIAAVNALLKTFEEPPSNTTFFFLTKDISDIISTVVSRAQCFFVPSKKDELQNFDLVKDFMENFLYLDRNEVLDFNDNLLNMIKENDAELIFTQMQNYLINLLKSNLNNKKLIIKLLENINSIESAKQKYKFDKKNIQVITENLAFELLL